MRMEGVHPITALSSEQADLLRELLRNKPELDESDLVLYTLREGGSSVDMVAPYSPDLAVGQTVVSAGWVIGAQSADSGGDDAVELHLTRSLVPE